MKNGIASVSTVSRLLTSIDEEMFCFVFIEWMTGMLETKRVHIAIDGKALRGGKITGLVIGQLPIKEKENEKTAIPKLLKLLNIKDSIITIYAMGTTQLIMDTILELLQVRKLEDKKVTRSISLKDLKSVM